MEPAEVARRALCQESSVSFLAQLLRENLGEVLQGMPVFPVLKGCFAPWKPMVIGRKLVIGML